MQTFFNPKPILYLNIMDTRLRDHFDYLLEDVLGAMPDWIMKLVEEVPLVVDDHPSEEVMVKTGVRHRRQLCGLYTGVPLTERSVWHSGTLPDRIMIYREGILNAAEDGYGHVTPDSLRNQIRITVLHELGHHHGLNEEDLLKLGYG
jgi:predicted Zn-dependent protease with MMP-like domain